MAPPNLPAELLSGIFLMLAWSHRVDSDVPQYGTTKDGSWIRVAHVCRHWRNAALDCALLWTDLMFNKPGLPEFMLSKSKNLPLTIEFNSFNKDLSPFINVLREATSQIYRLQSLVIRREESIDQQLRLAQIIGPQCTDAPILERVVLSRRVEWHSDDPEEVVPGDFLSGETPSLQHLDLTNCTIRRWDTLPLADGLTFLQLHADPRHASTRPDPAALFASICKLESLETLSLSEMLPIERLTSPDRPKMPSSIKHLALTDNTEIVNMFFETADVAQTTKLRVTFLNAEAREPLVHFILLLEISWNPTIRSTLFGLEFLSGEEDPDRLGFSFNRSRIIHEHELFVALEIRTRNVEYDPPPRLSLNHALGVFYQELDFTTLIALNIRQESPWDTRTWVSMFGNLPTLVLLSFQDNVGILGFLATL